MIAGQQAPIKRLVLCECAKLSVCALYQLDARAGRRPRASQCRKLTVLGERAAIRADALNGHAVQRDNLAPGAVSGAEVAFRQVPDWGVIDPVCNVRV